MAWTASITSIIPSGVDTQIMVQYTNGTRTITEIYSASDQSTMNTTLLNRVGYLEAQEAFINGLVLGPVDLAAIVPVSQTVSPEPVVSTVNPTTIPNPLEVGLEQAVIDTEPDPTTQASLLGKIKQFFGG